MTVANCNNLGILIVVKCKLPKRLIFLFFHMEAGNRCKDECLPEETNRRIVDIISDVLAYSEHAKKVFA